MMRMRRATPMALIGAAAVFASAGMQHHDWSSTLRHFSDYRQGATPETLAAFSEGLMADVELSALEASDFERLAPVIESSPALTASAAPRLRELAGAPDVAGAVAAALLFQMSFTEAGPDPEAARLAICHPALVEAAATGSVNVVYGSLGALDDELLGELTDAIVDAGRALEHELPPRVALQMTNYFKTLIRMDADVPVEALERARQGAIALAERAHARAIAEDRPQAAQALARDLEYLRSATPTHLLEGAPPLRVRWSSDPSVIATSPEELKGKVVLIDFFATWCQPCIAAFPDLRAIRERYAVSDVAILGVTSLQGAHYSKSGRVDTKGDPEREFALMREFMAEQRISWTVVFTEEPVFNPHYAVVGIPHVTIVDAQGRVRHNAINPHRAGAEQIIRWLDELLLEAGADLPAPPADR